MQYTLTLAPAIEVVYFCPDFEGNFCYEIEERRRILRLDAAYSPLVGTYRKPNPGMLLLAQSDFDRKAELMVGDRDEDDQAAQAAGVKFLSAEEWRKQ